MKPHENFVLFECYVIWQNSYFKQFRRTITPHWKVSFGFKIINYSVLFMIRHKRPRHTENTHAISCYPDDVDVTKQNILKMYVVRITIVSRC